MMHRTINIYSFFDCHLQACHIDISLMLVTTELTLLLCFIPFVVVQHYLISLVQQFVIKVSYCFASISCLLFVSFAGAHIGK